MFEVDSKSGDIALALPIPLGVLPATHTRTTDDPDLQSESKKTQVEFPRLSVERAGSLRMPLMVPIKDLRAAAGALTVKWRIVLL